MTHMPTLPEALRVKGICPLCKQDCPCLVDHSPDIYYMTDFHLNKEGEQCESVYATPSHIYTPLSEEQIKEYWTKQIEEEKRQDQGYKELDRAWNENYPEF